MDSKWTVASARGRFSELLSAVLRGPQAIFNRNKRVAVLVDPETFDEFEAWRKGRRQRTLWDDVQELRRACDEEDWVLPEAPRTTRSNPFVDEL